MLNIITEEPVITISVIVVVALTVFLVIKIMQKMGLEKVREYVYELFVKAEEKFKYGDNEDKFEYVISFAKKFIPMPYSLFITETLLRTVVQEWFDLCKDWLDDGILNGTSEKEE